VALPRTSAEQAREGRKLDKRLSELEPGDLLTFSNRGGQVTHVGMYLGDGRFVHSATRGVQVSVLSEADPYGRWWYRRWVGARRILEQH
jgi:cell wall-associated NlpC family hydrolase